jgi:hypothetical protein
MSDYKIPQNAITPIRHDTNIQRFDMPIGQTPVVNNSKPVLNQQPVDYTNVPVSRSVQKSSDFQLNDSQIDALIKNILTEKQTPVPHAYNAQSHHNDMQTAIRQNLQTNNHPIPMALR